ncbi:MAG TPA: hypothetical protein ENN16_00385, partial [Candidatus Omnitrophica bacterium]|nr:hypothetical protein [Candidatus Omnitrophota bacterium]
MSHFIYKARKSPREAIEGDIEAASESSAIAILASSGYYPIWIREAVFPRAAGKVLDGRINRRKLACFTRQISELLDSGLTLFDSLGIVEHRVPDHAFKEISRTVKNKIKEGNSFAVSLG